MDLITRVMSVGMVLRDILYVSYVVPACRIRLLVPAALPLATVQGDRVFISIVILKCRNVRPLAFPWFPTSYNQLNIRTYVRDPLTGENGVYFFKSAITSRFMLFVPRLLGLPWEHAKLTIDAEGAGLGETGRYRVSGYLHGEIFLDGYEISRPLERVEPLSTARELMVRLTTPSAAFFTRNTTIKRFWASHEYVEPSVVQIREFRFPYLASSGLVNQSEVNAPHTALLVREAPFVVYLPPRKLRKKMLV